MGPLCALQATLSPSLMGRPAPGGAPSGGGGCSSRGQGRRQVLLSSGASCMRGAPALRVALPQVWGWVSLGDSQIRAGR